MGLVKEVTFISGILYIINYAATSALYFPISFYLNKNWRFKLLMSIVSRSITVISLNPDKAKFFKISHPKPPAPITKILTWFAIIDFNYAIGLN